MLVGTEQGRLATRGSARGHLKDTGGVTKV
jgi:hypothetical protein